MTTTATTQAPYVGKLLKQKTRETDEYDAFGFVGWNRKKDLPSQSHIKNLVESMQDIGYRLDDRPIVVYYDESTKKFIIIDGQHRFLAAKQLGIKFSYVNGDTPDHAFRVARHLNRGQQNWVNDDYIHAYAYMGYKHYMVIEELADKYGMKKHIIATLLSGRTNVHKGNGQKIRDGEFSAHDRDYAVRVCRIVDRLASKYGLERHRNGKALVSAVARMCMVDEFDEAMLYRKIECGKAPSLCIDGDSYLRMFTDIYNYMNRKPIDLVFKANEIVRERKLAAITR